MTYRIHHANCAAAVRRYREYAREARRLLGDPVLDTDRIEDTERVSRAYALLTRVIESAEVLEQAHRDWAESHAQAAADAEYWREKAASRLGDSGRYRRPGRKQGKVSE